MIESCITFLPVSDLKRTVQFYTEVIGLTLWKDMGKPARHPKFPVYSFFFSDPDGYLLEFQKIVDDVQ